MIVESFAGGVAMESNEGLLRETDALRDLARQTMPEVRVQLQ
jgi:hypothetical protein